MPQVIVTKCELVPATGDYPNGDEYKEYEVTGTYDGEPFLVRCFDGQYEYEQYPPSCECDEPIQIAIGEYMEAHNIDPGRIHR